MKPSRRKMPASSKLGIDELRERWKAGEGKAPSRDIRPVVPDARDQDRLQEKAFAGLKPSTRRVLAELVHDGANESSLAAELSRIVRPGARCWCVNGAVSAIK